MAVSWVSVDKATSFGESDERDLNFSSQDVGQGWRCAAKGIEVLPGGAVAEDDGCMGEAGFSAFLLQFAPGPTSVASSPIAA
jgi:hypothetical protein